MNFANIFDIFVPRKNARPPTINAEVRKIMTVCVVISTSWLTTRIAPLRALSKVYAVAIEISILAVLIPPTKVRNPWSPNFPTRFWAIIAAWLEPNPGRNAAIKPTPVDAAVALAKFFLGRFNGAGVCLGIDWF